MLQTLLAAWLCTEPQGNLILQCAASCSQTASKVGSTEQHRTVFSWKGETEPWPYALKSNITEIWALHDKAFSFCWYSLDCELVINETSYHSYNLGDHAFNTIILWKTPMLTFLASITRNWKYSYLFFWTKISAVTTPSALALWMTMVSPGFLLLFSSIVYMLQQLRVSDKRRWDHCPDHHAHWKYVPKDSDFFCPGCDMFTRVV